MSYHKGEIIKKLKPNASAGDIEEKTTLIGAGLSGSANIVISPQGVIVTTASGAIHTATNADAVIKNASKTSTTNVHTKVKAACDKANAAGIIVMQQMPNDPEGWRAIGFETTEGLVADTVQATQPLHCSATQADELGWVDLHNDPVENADGYRDYVTKGPVADRDQYIDVTDHEGSTSSSTRKAHLPADYLNVPLNFITIPFNVLGEGIESVPYGGGRRIQ